MAQASADVLDQAGMSLEDVKLVVPHQANKRILDALAKRIGISEDKVFVNVHKYGNTSAGTIPVALAEALEEGKIKPDDHILMASFGAGLTYGAGLIKWSNRVIPLTTSDAEWAQILHASVPPCEKTGLEIIASHVDRYKKHSLESVS